MALVPGHDYPNSYRGFVEMFPDDTVCEAFLVRLRFRYGILTNRLSVELNNLANLAHFATNILSHNNWTNGYDWGWGCT